MAIKQAVESSSIRWALPPIRWALLPIALLLITPGLGLSAAPPDNGIVAPESTANPAYTVKPSALYFDKRVLGSRTTKSFWLSNHSGAVLPIVSIRLQGLAKDQYRVAHTCGTAVAADAGCSIRVTFVPTSVGEKLASLKVVALVAGQNVIRTRGLSGTGVASAANVAWTNWTAITTATADGDMGGVAVHITATSGGDLFTDESYTSCGFNFWTEPNPADPAYTGGTVTNAPTPCEQVALDLPVSVTVTFSTPVTGLYMALLSIGSRDITVTYDFDHAFTVDSDGIGYFSGTFDNKPGLFSLLSGDRIAMTEFHGVLAFTGPVSSLTFTTSTEELWQAFTFGRATTAQTGSTSR